MPVLRGAGQRLAAPGRRHLTRRPRVVFAALWPLALIAWIYERSAHLGFDVLDEGLIGAYTHRILDGQVPHRDFISPRPVGSALLHLVDLAVPLPNVLAERLVGIVTVVAYSLLLAWLVYDRPPSRWNALRIAGAVAATLVNLHTFAEASWYTFDGLLLASAGLLAARSSTRGGRAAALLLSGAAVTVKQSFFPAPLLILAILIGRERPAPRRVVLWTALAAAPMALYAIVIAALGGGGDMVDQLTGGRFVWGKSLLGFAGLTGPDVGRPSLHGAFPWEVVVIAAALSVPWLRSLAAVALAFVALWIPFHGDLHWDGAWTLQMMWALVLFVVMRAVLERRVDRVAVVVLLVGWMAMLSRSYDVPGLVGGTMMLVLLVRAAEAFQRGWLVRPLRLAAPLAALALLLFSGWQFGQARDREPYWDRARPELTARLDSIAPAFKGIRTTPVVATYLRGLQACVRRYPARWVAAVPDNPGLYDPLHLRNPFPIDWFMPDDYAGARSKITDSARALERRGHYLVLFETVSGWLLPHLRRLPPATRASVPAFISEPEIYEPQMARDLITILRGRHVVCGSFLGIWSE